MIHSTAKSSNHVGTVRGFTLIELLLVVTIIVLFSGVILAQNDRFGGQVQLEVLAYDIGLTIRNAQAYGTAVQKSSAGTYNNGYGIHLDVASPAAQTSYVLFADTNGNGVYNSGVDEVVELASIAGGFKINHLYAKPAGGSEVSVNKLDILYKRPTPDAWISRNSASCVAASSECMESAKIEVISPRGDTATVSIWFNGQISVATN